jgi:hypothetical protein
MLNPKEQLEEEGSSASPSESSYVDLSAELNWTQIQANVNKLGLTDEDKQMLNRYLSTIVQYTENPKTRALAYECLQFIFRMLNPDTFISQFNEVQYALYLRNSAKSLFRLIYLKYFDVDFSTKISLFWSTFNFMDMLFNRILWGRNKDYNIELSRAKNPPRIQGMN